MSGHLAICAACEQPIPKGAKFVLSGTEVFHRVDACIRLIAQSKQTRTTLRLQALEQERRSRLADVDGRIEQSKRELANLAQSMDNLEEIKRHVEEQRRAVALGKKEYAQLSANYRVDRERWSNARQQLVKQVDDLTAEIARRDAAVRAEAQNRRQVDERDATEVRFSLLEIDPL